MTPDPVAYATPPSYAQPLLPKKQGMAIASLVLGILALVLFWVPFFGWIVGILAIVFGAVGISQANKRPNEYGGKGMATAGLVMGIIQVGLWLLFFFVVVAAIGAAF